LVPAKVDYAGKRVVRMSCGADFSMIVDTSGGLYSFGFPEYGQLYEIFCKNGVNSYKSCFVFLFRGHNSDGKMLERAQKLSYVCEKSPRQITKFVEKDKSGSTTITNVCIKDVKCGVNHTIAMDDKGRVFTWGFGGYGRLGHAETKDEMIPRQVKVWKLEKYNKLF
jgi:alpha-tubulin suppressor-like RCC1 family protein